MISYNQLITVIESFASNHLQVKRFGAEFKEQLPNISTDGKSFPYLFMTPIGTTTGEFVKEIEVEIYCIDRLRKDRENTNDVVSDTEQILTDLGVWLEDGQTLIDVVRSYSATPLNNGTLDFVSGWSQRYKFELERIAECEIPIVGNVNGVPCADASYIVEYSDGTPIESGTIESGGNAIIIVPNCQEATVITKDSAGNILNSTNIPSGTSQDIIISDSTATNSLGTVLASIEAQGTVQLADVNNIDSDGSTVPTPAGVAFTCTPASDATLTLNTNSFLTVASGSTQDIELVDQDDVPIVPDSVVGNKITVNSAISAVTSQILKTGQKVSYATGDDGDVQRGRNFFTLPIVSGVQQLNHFGSKWAMTGLTGGYYDFDTSQFKDVSGSVTTRDLAFPNYLMLDHRTLDYDGNLNMFYLSSTWVGVYSLDFTTAKTYADALTVAGYNSWVVPNIRELLDTFFTWELSSFPPLTGSYPEILGTLAIISNTTKPSVTTDNEGIRMDTKTLEGYGKTSVSGVLSRVFLRVTNVSEL